MKTRTNKKYKTSKTKTGRLKNSAIPHMERLLNKDNFKTSNISI